MSLAAPGTNPASNLELKLPHTIGSANQLLKVDGSGQLGWATDSTTDSTKLPLAGGTLTGNLTAVKYLSSKSSGAALSFADSVEINLGTGDDLKLWHQTGNSYITSTGANLTLRAAGHLYLQDIDGNTMADFNDGGAVELYNNGNLSATTASDDFDVYRRLRIRGARDMSGDGLYLGLWDGSNYRIEGDGNRPIFITAYNSSGIKFGYQSGEKVQIDNSGLKIVLGGTLDFYAGRTTYRHTGSYGEFKNNTGELYCAAASNIRFYTDTSFSTERLRIGSNGGVCVGSTGGYAIWNGLSQDVNVKLEVRCTVGEPAGMALLEERGDSNGASFIIGKSRGGSGVGVINSGDTLGWIKFSGADGTRQHNAAGILAYNNGTIATGRVAGNLGFYTAPDSVSGFQNRLVINSKGDVAMGEHKSDTLWDSTSENGWYYRRNEGSLAMANNTGHGFSLMYMNKNTTNGNNDNRYIDFYWDTTSKGSITGNGSNTAYNTSSDYRLKENIIDITDGITRLKQLKPRRFNWIADSTNTVQDGFIAHEVSSFIPEAVTGTKDRVVTQSEVDANTQPQNDEAGTPIYQQMDYAKVTPLLTAALQEAITKIETLETKVAALEAG